VPATIQKERLSRHTRSRKWWKKLQRRQVTFEKKAFSRLVLKQKPLSKKTVTQVMAIIECTNDYLSFGEDS